MALTDEIRDGFTQAGQEVKAVRAAKADDSTVVHNTGAETISGLKTFVNGVAIAHPSAANMAVRHDDARLSDARTPTVHTHPATAVTAAPRSVTYANLAALAPGTGAVDVVTATLTGNPTITPAAGTDGQVIRLRLLAGSSARTVTLGSAVRLATGISARTLDITANQAGVIGLEYIAGLGSGVWVLFSAYATSN